MSISYEVDFTEDILACRGVKLPRNLMKLKDCHIFTMVNDHVHSAKLNLLPGHLVKKDWLFGPACEMDRKVIYPCSRYRCSVPCPCSSCLKLPTLPCKTIASCCSCGICNKKFEEHTQFHGTFHFDCKFCYNLVHCLPVFNFWFLNHSKTKRAVRYCEYFSREHFDVKDLVKNIHPETWKQNPNGDTVYRDYESYHARVEQISGKWFRYYMTCEECNYSVRCMKQFREHIELNHTVSKRFFHCYIDVKKEIGCFNCFICNVTHKTKRELERHTNRNHYGQTYVCDECPEAFTREDNLRRHKKYAHKKREEITCTDCGKSFARQDNLTKHRSLVHESSISISCGDCNTVFNKESSLSRHKKTALYPDGSFKHFCSDCEDRHFCTSKMLRVHKNDDHIGVAKIAVQNLPAKVI